MNIVRIIILLMASALTACNSYSMIKEGNSQVTLDELVEAGNSGELELVDGLKKLAQKRKNSPENLSPDQAIETLIALQKLDPIPAKEEIVALLEDEDEEVRYYAVKALAEIRDSSVIKPLCKAVEDEDELVAEAASRNLSRLTLIPIYKDLGDPLEWKKWWEQNAVYFENK